MAVEEQQTDEAFAAAVARAVSKEPIFAASFICKKCGFYNPRNWESNCLRCNVVTMSYKVYCAQCMIDLIPKIYPCKLCGKEFSANSVVPTCAECNEAWRDKQNG